MILGVNKLNPLSFARSANYSKILNSTPNSCRSYATLKDISLRLKSVTNISKITKSMKMIASTKFVRAQKALDVSRHFISTANSFYKHVEVKPAVHPSTLASSPASAPPETTTTNKSNNNVIIVVSSDRGLCGAIHSSLSKLCKRIYRESASSGEVKSSFVILGDKAKAQLSREAKSSILMSANSIAKVSVPAWSEVAAVLPSLKTAVASAKSTSDPEPTYFILYNRFVSALAYTNTFLPVPSVSNILSAEKRPVYEFDESILRDYVDFTWSIYLHAALVEGTASEMASRRTAMDNASKNAGEVINSLTMQYNRTRQAVITNELCDIITGASAL